MILQIILADSRAIRLSAEASVEKAIAVLHPFKLSDGEIEKSATFLFCTNNL